MDMSIVIQDSVSEYFSTQIFHLKCLQIYGDYFFRRSIRTKNMNGEDKQRELKRKFPIYISIQLGIVAPSR